MKSEIYRMQLVQSPIIPIVAELIRNHPGTISLGQGVVYYGPPPQAIAQIPLFLANLDNHKYKPVIGIPSLLNAISDKLQAENRITINHQNCLVITAGSNMAFMNTILAIANPGDEIILQIPYYFNHEMAITMANCHPVLVPTDENYQLQPQIIKQAITPKTRAIVTISPNNPTGAVYPREILTEINEICRVYNIYHIHDEAYEYFTYNDTPHFSPGSIPNSSEYTISLFTLSKAYGFAGWRIGYMVIPPHLLLSVNKIQDTILICPPVISQYAALGALQAGKSYCRDKLNAIAQVREIVLHELDKIQHLCYIPTANGAFYFLVKIYSNIPTMELVERLIREYQVAVIPGTTFGMENGCYVRIAYGSLQKETVVAGIGRLVRGLQAIVDL